MNAQQSAYGLMILAALGQPDTHTGGPKYHVYGGTVDYWTVQERRAKNKRARKSRKANRNG